MRARLVLKALRDDPANAEAFEFTTGNTDEALPFAEAQRRLTGPGHQGFRALAADVDRQLGLRAVHHDAIGDTATWGAEPALVTEIADAPDWDTVRYSAAWKGRHGTQKAVLPFIEDPAGPDHLYTFEVPGAVADLPAIRQTLDQHGVEFRTLQPTAAGTRVLVYHHAAFDAANETEQRLQKVGAHYGQDLTRHTGRGEFLGGDTREQGLAAFREVIDAHERGAHPRRYTPARAGVHPEQRPAPAPALAKSDAPIKGWLHPDGRVQAWRVDESEHPHHLDRTPTGDLRGWGDLVATGASPWRLSTVYAGRGPGRDLDIAVPHRHAQAARTAAAFIRGRAKTLGWVRVDFATPATTMNAAPTQEFEDGEQAAQALERLAAQWSAPIAKSVHVKGFLHASGRKTAWRTDERDGHPWHVEMLGEHTGIEPDADAGEDETDAMHEAGRQGWASWGVDIGDGGPSTLQLRIPNPDHGDEASPDLGAQMSNLIAEWAPRIERVEVDHRYGDRVIHGAPDVVLRHLAPPGWTPPAATPAPAPERRAPARGPTAGQREAAERLMTGTGTRPRRKKAAAPRTPRRRPGVPMAASTVVLTVGAPLAKALGGRKGFFHVNGDYSATWAVDETGAPHHDDMAHEILSHHDSGEARDHGWIPLSRFGQTLHLSVGDFSSPDEIHAALGVIRDQSRLVRKVILDDHDGTPKSATAHLQKMLPAEDAAEKSRARAVRESDIEDRRSPREREMDPWQHHRYSLMIPWREGERRAGHLALMTHPSGEVRIADFVWERGAQGVAATRSALRSAFQDLKTRGVRMTRVAGTRISGARDRAARRTGRDSQRVVEHPLVLKARSPYADQPRRFAKPTDVIRETQEDANWGGAQERRYRWTRGADWLRAPFGDPPRGQWGAGSGHLVTGRVLDRSDLPATLYHVTTAKRAVADTGVLLGQRSHQGMGGGQMPGVSFTTSPTSARLMARELTRGVRLARGEHTHEHLAQYAQEDEQEGGLAPGTLQPAVQAARDTFEVNARSPVYATPESRRSLAYDAFRSYLTSRDHVLSPLGAPKHPAYEALKNPLVMGQVEHLATVDPADVAILEVPSAQIPDGALVTTGSDDFLHEVRSYSDVPTVVLAQKSQRTDAFARLREYGWQVIRSQRGGTYAQHPAHPGHLIVFPARSTFRHVDHEDQVRAERGLADLGAHLAEFHALGKSIRGIVSPEGVHTIGDDEREPGLIHADLFARVVPRHQARQPGQRPLIDQGWVRFIHTKGPGGDLGIEYRQGNPTARQNAERLIRERGAQRRIFLDAVDDTYSIHSSVHDTIESALGSLTGGAPAASPQARRLPAWAPKAASCAEKSAGPDRALHDRVVAHMKQQYGEGKALRPSESMDAGWLTQDGELLADSGDHNFSAHAVDRDLGLHLLPTDPREPLRPAERFSHATGIARFWHTSGAGIGVEVHQPPTEKQLATLRGLMRRHRLTPDQFAYDLGDGTGTVRVGRSVERLAQEFQKSALVLKAHHPVWDALEPRERLAQMGGRRFGIKGEDVGHILFKPKGLWVHVNPDDDPWPSGRTLDELDAHLRARRARPAAALPHIEPALHQAALAEFGETHDEREAGYLLPDGRLLDFSGKREGGQPGMRSYDHRDIGRLQREADGHEFNSGGLAHGGTDGMIEFMHRAGAVRVHVGDDFVSFDSAHPPTDVQARTAVRWARARRAPLTVEWSDQHGDTKNTEHLDRPTVEAVHRVFTRTDGRMRRSFGGLVLKARSAVAEAPAKTLPHQFPVFQAGHHAGTNESETPIFASGLAALLHKKMPRKASLDQVRAILKDAKKDEVQWSGLGALLEDPHRAGIAAGERPTFKPGDMIGFQQSSRRGEPITYAHQKKIAQVVRGPVPEDLDAQWATHIEVDSADSQYVDPANVIEHNGQPITGPMIDKDKLLTKLGQSYKARVHEQTLGAGGIDAESWDDLDERTQEEIESAWKDYHRDSAIESERDNWAENGEADLEGRKAFLDDHHDWLNEKWQAWLADDDWWAQDDPDTGMKAGVRPPFSARALDPSHLKFRVAGDGDEWDEIPYRSQKKGAAQPWGLELHSQVPAGLPWNDAADPRQSDLPGLERTEPIDRGKQWQKWGADFMNYIREDLHGEIERRVDAAEPDEDYLRERADESLDEDWENQDDDERFRFARERDILEGEGHEPKYKQYQLPWKESGRMYREHLFTVPHADARVRTGHFDANNLAVHARVSGRDIPGVGNTLLIEEIQSDAQKTGRDRDTDPLPFTNAYHELPMKRLLREAVDRGDDALAWTSGAQQTHRWQSALRRVVQKLQWEPSTDGPPESPYGRLTGYDHDGNEVLSKDMSHDDLVEHVGKASAEKLLAATPQADVRRTEERTLDIPWSQIHEAVQGDHRFSTVQTPGAGALARLVHTRRSDGSGRLDVHYVPEPGAPAVNIGFYDHGRANGPRIPPAWHRGTTLEADLGRVEPRVTEIPGPARRTLEGDDIVVGGQGFVNVYDQAMVNFANKYTKKWGGQVTQHDVSEHFTEDKADTPGTIHVLKITDAMRTALRKEPQMLFSRRDQDLFKGGLLLAVQDAAVFTVREHGGTLNKGRRRRKGGTVRLPDGSGFFVATVGKSVQAATRAYERLRRAAQQDLDRLVGLR